MLEKNNQGLYVHKLGSNASLKMKIFFFAYTIPGLIPVRVFAMK